MLYMSIGLQALLHVCLILQGEAKLWGPLGYKLDSKFVWHCRERPNYSPGHHTTVGHFGAFPWVLQAVPLPLNNGLGSADSGTHLTLELALEGLLEEPKWAVPNLTQPMYYNSCTVRSSEHLFSSCGGPQDKRKTGWNSGTIKNWMLMYFFCRFFINLTLCMTKGTADVFSC
jgi:hypothetical protein